jgi:class 3 adenylate cyclase
MAALTRLLAPVGRVAEVMAWRRKAQNILETYLGKHAGEKVLAGQIRRGDGEDMHAVIWFCDLRDSTPLADSMRRDEFLRSERVLRMRAGPVLERQGEILRFIGDAALAIFPCARSRRGLPPGGGGGRDAIAAWRAPMPRASGPCASASRCTWATCSTATSARPRAWNSP